MRIRREACQTLGCKAVGLIKLFPSKFPNISRFNFESYLPEKTVEKRLHENVRLECLPVEKLLKLDLDLLIGELLKHIDFDSSSNFKPVSAVNLVRRLSKLEAQSLSQKNALALCSLCKDKRGQSRHIPMMDFRIKSGADVGQINLLTKALNRLGQRDGVLLDSGQSYHFYGFKLLNTKEWIWFMLACLQLGPLVDIRYISHRMRAGTGTLRLTSTALKPAPEVVAYIHESKRTRLPSWMQPSKSRHCNRRYCNLRVGLCVTREAQHIECWRANTGMCTISFEIQVSKRHHYGGQR